MHLFYAPGASSQAPHILLREAGLPFSLERVDLATHRWSGGDYRQLNPKAYVPFLKLSETETLSECAVILQYIADQVPAQSLISAPGTLARYHDMEWLNFIATELHKNFITPERHNNVAANFLSKTAEGQEQTRLHVAPRLAYVDTHLQTQPYLGGEHFSAPDAYLFTMLTWAERLGFGLSSWPNLAVFFARVKSRPAVQKTLEVEGPPHSLRE